MFRSFIHLLEVIPNSTSIMPMTSTYKISPVIVIKQGVFKNLQRTRPVIIYQPQGRDLASAIKSKHPAVGELSGLLQSDGKVIRRTDVNPMAEWQFFFLGGGRCVTWDITVTDTLALSCHIRHASVAAKTAAGRKKNAKVHTDCADIHVHSSRIGTYRPLGI